MNSSVIVRKTPKGEDEIKTRSAGLPANLRIVLILVDGSSTVAELASKGQGLSDLPGALQALAAEGFVEFVDPGRINLDAVKQELIGAAQQVLGKNADRVVKKLQEAPPTKQGLLEASANCRKLVQLFIDESKAEQLMARCSAILGRI